MNSVLYDRKLEGNFNNWFMPDATNQFYIDSNPGGASGTISDINGRFSFSYSDTNTFSVDFDNGNDTTGTGTNANPYKTIFKAADEIIGQSIVYQIKIKTASRMEDTTEAYFEIGAGITVVRIFAEGGKTPVFGGKINIGDIGSASTWELYNFYHNAEDWWYEDQGVSLYLYYYLLLNTNKRDTGINRYTIPQIFSSNLKVDAPTTNTILYMFSSGIVNGWAFNTDANYWIFAEMENSLIKNFRYDTGQTLVTTFKFPNTIYKYNIFNSIDKMFLGDSAIANPNNYPNFYSNYFYNEDINSLYFDTAFSTAQFVSNYANLFKWDTTPVTGINDALMFIVPLPIIANDYKLQTIEGGYSFDSSGYLTGYPSVSNVGIFQGEIVKAVSYRKYEFSDNPSQYKNEKIHVGFNSESTRNARTYPYSSGLRQQLTISYSENRNTPSSDTSLLEYVGDNIFERSDPYRKTFDDIVSKFFQDIENGEAAGTITNNDIDNKRLYLDQTFEHDQYKGFEIWLIDIDSTSVTVSGNVISGFTDLITGFPVNYFIDHWVYVDGMIYNIISYTATTITVADYYGNLSNGSFTAFIYMPFKILKQINNEVILYDPTNKLNLYFIKYKIQELNCVSMMQAFKYNVIAYKPPIVFPKTGRTFLFIETI